MKRALSLAIGMTVALAANWASAQTTNLPKTPFIPGQTGMTDAQMQQMQLRALQNRGGRSSGPRRGVDQPIINGGGAPNLMNSDDGSANQDSSSSKSKQRRAAAKKAKAEQKKAAKELTDKKKSKTPKTKPVKKDAANG